MSSKEELKHTLEEISDRMEQLIQEEEGIYYKLREAEYTKIPKKCEHCNSVYGYEKQKPLSKKDLKFLLRKMFEERLDTIEFERMELESRVLDILNKVLGSTIFEVADLHY